MTRKRTIPAAYIADHKRACNDIRASYPENITLRDRMILGLVLYANYHVAWKNPKGDYGKFEGK